MTTAQPTYHNNTVEVLKAGERRFLIKSGNGAGHSYSMERALGIVVRRAGAVIERTGHGSTVYLQLPEFSKATGQPSTIVTAQMLANFIASK